MNTENKIPLPGDVGGIWVQEKNRIGHTFFIDEWEENDSRCTTVEGNYSNQVIRKWRLKSQIYRVSRWIE